MVKNVNTVLLKSIIIRLHCDLFVNFLQNKTQEFYFESKFKEQPLKLITCYFILYQ